MRLIVIAVGRLKQGPERSCRALSRAFDDIGRKLGFGGLKIQKLEAAPATPAHELPRKPQPSRRYSRRNTGLSH